MTFVDSWMFRSAVGGGLVLLLTALLMLIARQPARRQRLGEWGIAGALAVALLSLLPSWLEVPLRAQEEAPPPREPRRVYVRAVPAPETNDVDPVTESLPVLPSAEEAVAEEPTEAVSQAGMTWPDARTCWIAGYILVAAILVGRWLLGYLALYRLVRRSRPAGPELRVLVNSILVADRRPPRLLVSKHARMPMSFGLFRPTIILPRSLCHPWDAERVRWVLAHELTHLERGDMWACHLFGWGQALFFYVPWFWWMRRQVRLCQEYIADSVAAAQAPQVEDYAQFLVQLSSQPVAFGNATGFLGTSSDLFRRVTMLLKSVSPVEKRCSGLFSLGIGALLMTLAVGVSGLGVRAQAAPPEVEVEDVIVEFLIEGDGELEKEIQKIAEKLAKDPTNEELEKALKAAVEKLKEQAKKAKAKTTSKSVETFSKYYLKGACHGGHGRLGINVEPPGSALIDHLDLPKGRGMVVESVRKDGAADKGGMKKNDILLEIDGKDVPSDYTKLAKLLSDIKADKEVNIVVLRRGKKETLKDVKLPEAKDVLYFKMADPRPTIEIPFPPGVPPIGKGVPAPVVPRMDLFNIEPGSKNFRTSVFRSGERAIARHEEGSLIITVTSKIEDGKARLTEAHIQDGKDKESYEKVDKVPERYRDKVTNLMKMSEKEESGTRR